MATCSGYSGPRPSIHESSGFSTDPECRTCGVKYSVHGVGPLLVVTDHPEPNEHKVKAWMIVQEEKHRVGSAIAQLNGLSDSKAHSKTIFDLQARVFKLQQIEDYLALHAL